MNRVGRILMTADTVGGVWTYAMELSRALGRQGIDVAVATMGPLPNREQRKEASALGNVELFESWYKLEWMENPWLDVAAAGDWLLELESRVQPELIHLNGYAHGALPWQHPVVVVAHSCVLSWWRAVHGCTAPAAEWRPYTEAVRKGLGAADTVVAPTATMLSLLERHYGTLRAATVIPNGRDVRPVRTEEKQPFILSAGRIWDEAKNIRALTEVAAELPWPVYVAGEEREPGAGRRFEPEKMLLPGRGTHWLPRSGRAAVGKAPVPGQAGGAVPIGKLGQAEMARWFSAAAIYALPAKYEPFGLSAVEAALCGCALVLGDIASLREVWGDAAVFVPPHDTASLKTELLSLIEDKPRRVAMATRARHVARQYTPSRMVSGYLDVYNLLAAREGVHSDRREFVPCG